MEENKKKKAKIGRIIYYCLIGLFGTAFVVSLVLIGIYFFNSSQVGSEYDELSNIRQSILANQTTTATIPDGVASHASCMKRPRASSTFSVSSKSSAPAAQSAPHSPSERPAATANSAFVRFWNAVYAA